MSMDNKLLKRVVGVMAFAVACCLASSSVCAQLPDSDKRSVCLNMIVKNERSVITRCLESLLPMIDYWVIVDTGSDDVTQEVITTFMQEKGVSGELYERPWVNFAHNRNEAMELAKGKGDYLLFIDADEYHVYSPEFAMPHLDQDYYYIKMQSGGMEYHKVHLVNNRKAWSWQGVLHEVIVPPVDRTSALLDQVVTIYTLDGVRSRNPNKYSEDAQVLEKALAKEPTNSRYRFYLAQSYFNDHNDAKALENYEKRIEMGGWPEEVFYSMVRVGQLKERLNAPAEDVVSSYLRAFRYRPSRVEPLYYLASYYRKQEEFDLGYQVTKLGLTVRQPADILFVEKWMYDYGIDFERSICAWWIGEYEECQRLSLQLLERSDLSDEMRGYVEHNLRFANVKILEEITLRQ